MKVARSQQHYRKLHRRRIRGRQKENKYKDKYQLLKRPIWEDKYAPKRVDMTRDLKGYYWETELKNDISMKHYLLDKLYKFLSNNIRCLGKIKECAVFLVPVAIIDKRRGFVSKKLAEGSIFELREMLEKSYLKIQKLYNPEFSDEEFDIYSQESGSTRSESVVLQGNSIKLRIYIYGTS